MSINSNLKQDELTDTKIGISVAIGIAIGAAFGAISGEGNIGAGMVMGASFTAMGLFLYLRQKGITIFVTNLTVTKAGLWIIIGLAMGAVFGAVSGEGNVGAGTILGGSLTGMSLGLLHRLVR